MKNRWRAALASVATGGLLSLGLMAVPGVLAPAHALTCPTESSSFGGANLISADDMDLENGVGDWLTSANATVSQGTGTTMLHNAALKDVVPANGTTSVKLSCGAGPQGHIPVTAGDTYRVGAWVNTGRTSGETVYFSFGGYDGSGTWKGWTDGTANTVANTTGYHWYQDVITVPTGVTNIQGVKETVTGAVANDTIRSDEFLMYPQRPSLLIGCDGGTTASAWTTANNAIGPCQQDKLFFGGALPTTWNASSNDCNGLPENVVCTIAFKSNGTATDSFITSLAANDPGRYVVFVYHQEPEGDYTNGSTFVSEAETAYAQIKADAAAAGISEHVFTADDSGGFPYHGSGAGTDCSYIVPSQGNGTGNGPDFYWQDRYQPLPTGGSIATTGQYPDETTNWEGCVESKNGTSTFPKPAGLGEYGLGNDTATVSTRTSSINADGAYLQSNPTGVPFTSWDYWDENNADDNNTGNWKIPDPSTQKDAWVGFETQNGGGA